LKAIGDFAGDLDLLGRGKKKKILYSKQDFQKNDQNDFIINFQYAL